MNPGTFHPYCHRCLPGFLHECWTDAPRSCTYMANTSVAKPSPQPQCLHFTPSLPHTPFPLQQSCTFDKVCKTMSCCVSLCFEWHLLQSFPHRRMLSKSLLIGPRCLSGEQPSVGPAFGRVDSNQKERRWWRVDGGMAEKNR